METPVISRNLLSGASALNTAGAVALNGTTRHHVLYIEGSAGVSAGAVAIEEASGEDYGGTWGQVTAPVAVVAGAVVAVHVQGCYGALRARVSTAVVDGTVSVRLIAN